MSKRFIMTAFGKDRPGIVADVAGLVYDSGCNLEDSAMTCLADEFVVILLFSGYKEGLEARLYAGISNLEKEKGITVFYRPLAATEGRVLEAGEAEVHTLHVEGYDQAGIVYRVSKCLADHKVNITDLSSMMKKSPESGANIYSMEIKIQVSEDASMDELDKGLTAIEEDLNVDITRTKA